MLYQALLLKLELVGVLFHEEVENGGELCAKEYCAISDGIYRIYAMDGGSFGEFDYFDYAPGVLTGYIGSDTDNPVYVEFSHR